MPIPRVEIPESIQSEIAEQNQVHWRDKSVFNVPYFVFLKSLVDKYLAGTPSVPEQSFEVARLALRFLFVTLARSASKEPIWLRWVSTCSELLRRSPRACAWLIERMCDPGLDNWIRVYMLAQAGWRGGRVEMVQQAAGELSCTALHVLLKSEQKSEVKMDSRAEAARTLCYGFANRLVEEFGVTLDSFVKSDAYDQRQSRPSWMFKCPVFETLSSFARISAANTSHLCSRGLLINCLQALRVVTIQYARSMSTVVQQALEIIAQMVQADKTTASVAIRTFLSEDLAAYRFMMGAFTMGRAGPTCAIVCCACEDDIKTSKNIITNIGLRLIEMCHETTRPLFRVLRALILLNDSVQAERCAAVAKMLVDAFKGNSRYWKVCDYLAEHSIRLAAASPRFAAEMRVVAGPIAAWLRAHPNPPQPIVADTQNSSGMGGSGDSAAAWAAQQRVLEKGGILNDKNRSNLHVRFVLTASSPLHPYSRSVADKVKALDAIADGKTAPVDPAYDSDTELDNRRLEVGSQVDCLDNELNWLPAQVVDVKRELGRVHIRFDGYEPKWNEWVKERSPRLQPRGTFCPIAAPPPAPLVETDQAATASPSGDSTSRGDASA